MRNALAKGYMGVAAASAAIITIFGGAQIGMGDFSGMVFFMASNTSNHSKPAPLSAFSLELIIEWG